MSVLYGIPYMGSKTKIAPIILSKLPKGERFVDLFGGGFAMSHCASLSNRFNYIYYNDFNPLIVGLVIDAYHGKYSYSRFKPEFITRDIFEKEKDRNGYIKYIWSYGNSGHCYKFGKGLEQAKHDAHDFVVFGKQSELIEKMLPNYRKHVTSNDIHQRRLQFCGYARSIKRRFDLQQLEQLERLQQLEQLERLQQLEQLERQRIEFNVGSYDLYEYCEGDVVYLDPPYEGTAEYSGGFDHEKFYDWVASRDYQVWFSSYNISNKDFKMVYAKQLRTSFGAGNKAVNYECLYTNK